MISSLRNVILVLSLSVFLLLSHSIYGQSINFSVSKLEGTQNSNPTSLMFGPDFRLYVSNQFGIIKVYQINRNEKDDYDVTDVETIDIIQTVPNHDDNGERNFGINSRQITGLYVTGTALVPIIYVSHSDPRQGGGSGGTDKNLDTNSGMISKLTWNGNDWEKIDIVRGLPRSEENHAPNGMALDETTNTLYIGIGGLTNAGAPSAAFTYISEYALSAAILSIDLNSVEALPTQYYEGQAYKYDIPTLDDPTREGAEDNNDPFGGNDGLNMAKIISGGPVQVYSSGWRNPYDVVLTESQKLYSIDNGANLTWGGYPKNEGTGEASNEYVEGEPGYVNNLNGLHYISEKGYYAGHPNPIRANPFGAGLYTDDDGTGVWRNSIEGDNPLPADWPPVSEANPVEGDFRQPGEDDGSLVVYVPSTNGLCEYTASNFDGTLKGNIISAGLTGEIFRAALNEEGNEVTNGVEILAEGFGNIPLDVVAIGDNNGPYPGTIWIADFGNSSIFVMEPADYGGKTVAPCFGEYIEADDDEDGFLNIDEIDSGTNPCSASSKPDDADKDFISDINDQDDDNDGIPDVNDPFALDPDNGLTTDIPLFYDLLNGDPGFGFFGLGMTGIMVNGETNYLDQYDQENIIAGGTSGLLTTPTTDGDAVNNNQDNGFQFGINVSDEDCPFTIKARLKTPIFPVGGPYGQQSQGIFIGTGDQDNYVKVIINNNIQVLKEDAGIVTSVDHIDPDIQFSDPNFIELFLTVFPATGQVQASYQLGSDQPIQLAGPLINVGEELKDVLQASDKALAVGVISTSIGADSFNPTWDFIEITQADVAPGAALMEIKSFDGLESSVHTTESFTIENLAQENQDITRVSLDLSVAAFANLIFDTDNTSKDALKKVFTVDGGEVETGFIRAELSKPLSGGFQRLDMFFEDFDEQERFTFSVDIDPVGISSLGVPLSGNIGDVGPLELTGAEVSFEYAFCGEQKTKIFPHPGESLSSEAISLEAPINEPTLRLKGIPDGTSNVTKRKHTVEIADGPANAAFTLFHLVSQERLSDNGLGSNPLIVENLIRVREVPTILDENGNGQVEISLIASSESDLVNYVIGVAEINGEEGQTISSSIKEYRVVPEDCETIRINGGSEVATLAAGVSYDADKYFDKGGSWGGFWVGEIEGTDNDPIYQVEHSQSADGFTYNIPLTEEGIVSVQLHFAELFHEEAGKRVFNVNLEGGEIELENLDVYAEVGYRTALVKSFDIEVSDGELTIDFIPNIDQPIVSAIEVSQVCEGTLLPVEFLNFSANVEGSTVLLNWITASERDNDFFQIERSIDGRNFDPIGKVTGLGNSQDFTNYRFVDNNPVVGITYYRLGQVDVDGRMSYSKLLSVTFYSEAEKVEIFPNPMENQAVNVRLFGFEENKDLKLLLSDTKGRQIWKKHIQTDVHGFYSGEISELNLGAGIYFMQISGRQTIVEKLIVR